ncbi:MULTISPECIES: hypothetical protein [unclassified Roseofilum]|uniref:hypothetical protein n=1 Tax=unclassified Roseofilum TaxID=2620099 RepID=UPI000E9BB1D0|nr:MULTISPECIES: hypothetical protein [unclassified Roseofilum]MBP0007980.1 serine/threonine protein kinase [Roseofilum sp. Belize Diploria]MBP0032374.1 serine/threonine protein kinase [Roseofilum sp. Belize BBD 4]HBQ97754.1 serine/threonine protein kinase [Cyanobacteria bacterium UBA11691]
MNELGHSFKYTAYGLTVQANKPVPFLTSARKNAPVDVWVELMTEDEEEARSPEAVSSSRPKVYSNGVKPIYKGDRTHFHLWFRGDGQIDFQVDADGRHIGVTWTRSVLEEVTTLLVGSVLGCTLRLQGVLSLHACVVKMGQQAIAIAGETGAGKSTTAAALAKRGYPILADDIAAIGDRSSHFVVHPGYPRLRLWPESITALYGSEVGLNRVFDFMDKRFLDLSGSVRDNEGETQWQFYQEPLPLAAIYILGKRQPELAAPQIESIPSAMALMKLMEQRSVSHLKLEKDRQEREFTGFSRVAMKVPIRKVTRGDSLDALPQLCDAILEDLASLTPSENSTQLSKTADG